MHDSEAELRREFAVRVERFEHAGLRAEILMPAEADALIDASEFNRDERLPYWAELWPSARALARHLLENPPHEAAALEVGCGLGLPSLVLLSLGRTVLATDYDPDGLRFARANARRNALPDLPTRLADWREPTGLQPRPLVLAADVLYERRNAEPLARLLPRVVARGGRALLADPGRAYVGAFLRAIDEAGWSARELEVRPEALGPAHPETLSRIRIVELRPPAGRDQSPPNV